MQVKKPRIGIALGSGSSRGWAHIGVLRALAEIGIEPDIVCGCSVGSIVGAAYVAKNLDGLEQWVKSLTRLELIRFFELNATLNGFVRKDKLQQFFNTCVCNEEQQIQDLTRKFATVSTDLVSGREIWFTQGSVLEAVWASIALPGLFPPYYYNNQWLVDGGLVNPVPISLCRALGADFVIAVNLNSNITRRHAQPISKTKPDTTTSNMPVVVTEVVKKSDNLINAFTASLREYSANWLPESNKDKSTPAPTPPGLMDAVAASINIMQDKITRSRMAGDPPEILLTPRLEHIGLLEFYRAEEAIAEGRKTVERMQEDIHETLAW